MRAALWLLALFGTAAAVALFAGNNPGTLTVFWPPTRVDLSLNLALLGLALLFVLLYLALRALSALFSLPRQARQWRLQQKERALHVALLDAMAQLMAGRYTRARKLAQLALAQERDLAALGAALPHARQLRVVAQLLAAESAQQLQNRAARDDHLQQALADRDERGSALLPELREGLQLRAARWALEDHDSAAALARLAELPQGAQRRTLALRLRLKAARLDRRTLEALETARMLAKHRVFSPAAGQTLVRGLAGELIAGAHDPVQLQRAWSQLDAAERARPEVAIQAARRLLALEGDPEAARAWLLPVWEQALAMPAALGEGWRLRLVQVLEAAIDEAAAPDWLARAEAALQTHPRDPLLQYLAGMVCLKRQLWGKAQQQLEQATRGPLDGRLARRAWVALAQLAEQRDDGAEAARAWKRAAQAEDAAAG